MKYDYYIAVLTRGRTNKQATLKMLQPEIRSLVNVYCHPGERRELMKEWGDKVNSIQEYSEECTHVGEVREYILHNSNANNVIFMDDNLRLQTKNKGNNSVTKSGIYEMIPKHFNREQLLNMQIEIFDWLFTSLETFAMAGLSFRPFNRDVKVDYKINTRIFAIWGINVDKYLSQEQRFMDWSTKEDFAVHISLIKKGYNTITNFHYSFDKTSGANTKGGCSSYRTLDNSNRAAEKLQEAFPDIVKIRSKVRKNWHGEFEGVESEDVIIQWNKIK